MDQQKHVAVVLAAGGSLRLGTPKQLLRRDAETLVHRSLRLVAATDPLHAIVVLGANHEQFAAELEDLRHVQVVNPDWRTGLAGSVRAAAPHVPTDHLALIVACDQPALDAQHLHNLLAGAGAAPARCAATDTGSVLGIPAVVPGAWFHGSHTRADHGFRDRLRSLSGDEVYTLRAPELALDIDTPADLEDAIARGFLDALPSMDRGQATIHACRPAPDNADRTHGRESSGAGRGRR
jgi:molybdenum cofactor cytidylyltransferase